MPSDKRPTELLPLKNDFVFKLVFGDQRNIDLLTSFLQAVLDLPKEEYDEVTIIDPHVNKEHYQDKTGVLDVKITTKSGNIIDVEIQVEPIVPMHKRISFYQAKMLLEQIGSGEDYTEIKKVISIIITDYRLIPNSAAYHHRFRFYDADNKVELTDTQEIHILEMPKLPKQSDATDLFDWMTLIGTQNEEDLTMLEQKKPEYRKVVAIVKQFSADELAKAQYEQREKWRMDYSASMKYAAQQGMESGLAKGRATGIAQGLSQGLSKGKDERSFEIAQSMKVKGIETSLIIELTGLSAKQIEELD